MNTAASTVTAIIADDEHHLSNFLKDRLAALWPELNVVALAANGPEALRLIDDHVPDIVFLDIRMPGLTGLEVAGRIDAKTRVVFVTAFDQYAVDAFDREAVDYLLKPVTDDRLKRAIERLKAQLAAQEAPQDINALLKSLTHFLPPAKNSYLRFIRASVGELTKQIPVDEIFYFQAQDKYISVYTKEGESLIRTPLAELQTQLNPDEFWQIHRSTIVNVNCIAGTKRDIMGHTLVKLKAVKTELSVSRGYAHLFKGM